ncbi:MAG: D-alanyl-D-alanine carboxypeptidase/D-alanyl-D-alanine-endopeptidase, partial [Phaeodactylibacter sp.]|nr:D-alanyl-D-alanine carboxypeptidase/D-alanyl-D-alanine-endopeptidase [Phaeodactylibacter sp.]
AFRPQLCCMLFRRSHICVLVFVLLNPFHLLKGQHPLQVATQQFANHPNLKGAQISIAVIDEDNNELVAEYRAKEMLAPASSLKVLTTASALIALGENFRYKTRLEYTGTIAPGGILQGDLYLTGFGDPTLGSSEWEAVPDLDAVLKTWAEAVKRAGIRQIEGRVIADAGYFSGDEPIPASWEASDVGKYYGAGVWGLNLHENLFYRPFRQKKYGQTPGVAPLEPTVEGLRLVNQVRSAGSSSGDNAYIYGGPYEFEREVKGSIPSGSGIFRIKGSIPDAPLFAAQALSTCLKEEGVGVLKAPTVVWSAPAGKTLLHQMESPALPAIVRRANLKSVNLYCEALLKTIAKQEKGQGTRAMGIQAIAAIWAARGVDLSTAQLIDGCGLSRSNKISAYLLASVLRKSLKDPQSGTAMRQSLPVAGLSGTLETRMKGTYAEGRLAAKTGSLKGVRSYTGLVRSRSGQNLVFSIIVNDYQCSGSALRQQMEKWMVALASS